MKPFWNGFLLSLSLCLDLGIVNAAVLETSLQRGGAAGFLLGAGSCIGDLVYFTLAVMGAAAVVQWRPMRWVLWIGGTLVLLWLAFRMIRDVVRPRTSALAKPSAISSRAGASLLLAGAGLALASPTAILWFAAVGGSVIATFGADRTNLGAFAAGFAGAGLVWAAVFAYAAASLRAFGSRAIQALSLVSAALFLYFAAVVFVAGLRDLV